MTAEGTILGTLQYMAPEQLEAKEADARTDIFAFGAIVYEMVTGRRSFDATEPGEPDRGDPGSRSPGDVNPAAHDAIVTGAGHQEMPRQGSRRPVAVRRRSAGRTQMDRRRHARRRWARAGRRAHEATSVRRLGHGFDDAPHRCADRHRRPRCPTAGRGRRDQIRGPRSEHLEST